jgi:hypothetical protein
MVEEFDGEEFDGEAGRKDDSSACVARRAGTCTADLYLCLYVQPQPLEPATFPGPCKRTGNRGWLAVSKTTTMHQRWLGDAGLFAVLDKLHRNGNARLAQCTAVREAREAVIFSLVYACMRTDLKGNVDGLHITVSFGLVVRAGRRDGR